jgi:Spondin_N
MQKIRQSKELSGALGVFILLAITVLTTTPTLAAEARSGGYEVTVTNLTRGQRFTPILVATHKQGVRLFELGSAASAQLRTLAEEGDTGPLAALLASMPEVKDVVTSTPPPPASNLIDPGESITLPVETSGGFDHVSLAAMLIPTNDAFFALNGVEGPRGNSELTIFVPAYDAGTEANDESCGSIPGPGFIECVTPSNPDGNGGGAMIGGGEGYVHIHAGIHGVGGGLPTSNLNASLRDWRNPVAKVTIRRVQ